MYLHFQVAFVLGCFIIISINGTQIQPPKRRVHWRAERMLKSQALIQPPDRIQKLYGAHGGSILTCNTVKCRGGNKCIMTKDECNLPFTTDPFTPTECESRPKCVPDKICKACGPNEHRSRCSICERTCEDPNRYRCKKENICGQNSRCVCDSGFVRNKNGNCIKYEKCPNVPKRTTTTPKETTTTTPEDQGFIIISRKETKQRHEQIDLLKSSTKKPSNNNQSGPESPNRPKRPTNPTNKPDDGFIVVKEKGQKQTKRPSTKTTTTEKPDDGFIVVKEKHNNKKPDHNRPNLSGKNPPNDKPDNRNPQDDKPDDGFIIVKGKDQKHTKRPSNNNQPSTKTTEKPDDGFIVVQEKRKNHKDRPKPEGENKDDSDYFVSKKKVQNNKHEQINLM